ncbi:hypothetical protein ACGFNU_38285 [Spirillospora sp. NPDC048911]|uniref:hypothetical protein n=1 Tax=Spirillospora sp. NPDC048911 TaxID=3364527 RepID=UPI0037176EE7
MTGKMIGGMDVEAIGNHVPFLCPYGHPLGENKVLVGWIPCDCTPALSWHRGHRSFQCRVCQEQEGRTSICYLPPHQAADWLGHTSASNRK